MEVKRNAKTRRAGQEEEKLKETAASRGVSKSAGVIAERIKLFFKKLLRDEALSDNKDDLFLRKAQPGSESPYEKRQDRVLVSISTPPPEDSTKQAAGSKETGDSAGAPPDHGSSLLLGFIILLIAVTIALGFMAGYDWAKERDEMLVHSTRTEPVDDP